MVVGGGGGGQGEVRQVVLVAVRQGEERGDFELGKVA